MADINQDGKTEVLVLVTEGDAGTTWLYAYDLEDGHAVWRHDLGGNVVFLMPILSDCDGDGALEIVVGAGARVLVLAASDGAITWEGKAPSRVLSGTVADMDGSGAKIIVNDYGQPHQIHVLDPRAKHVLWSRSTSGSSYALPTAGDIDGDGIKEIISHSHLYNPPRERLHVWNASGELLWTYDSAPSAEQQAHTPPELGYVPDFGYLASTVADFDGDGAMEIGWGTRCHYYVLEADGTLLWAAPLVTGHGVAVLHAADGAVVSIDLHGVGGPAGLAGAIGNVDGDAQMEVILSSAAEYRLDCFLGQPKPCTYQAVAQENTIRAWDGLSGDKQWAFQGAVSTNDIPFNMHDPILVDLDGDGGLDVLALSTDGNLYGVDGKTGQGILKYQVSASSRDLQPYGTPGPLLMFLPCAAEGRLLYKGSDDGRLHLLRLAARAQPLYLPLIERRH